MIAPQRWAERMRIFMKWNRRYKEIRTELKLERTNSLSAYVQPHSSVPKSHGPGKRIADAVQFLALTNSTIR